MENSINVLLLCDMLLFYNSAFFINSLNRLTLVKPDGSKRNGLTSKESLPRSTLSQKNKQSGSKLPAICNI